MRGVDYSWARPGGAAIKAAGFEFVMRYVPYPGDGGKGIDTNEIADLRANGLAIGLVWESTAGRMFDGYPAGVEDAQQCEASGAALGFPVELPFYFACDVDTDPAMLAYVDDYLAGCAAVLGIMRVGIYGEFDVVEHTHEVGSAAWYWQTYAWSGGQGSDWRHIYQYLNEQALGDPPGAVDYNDAAAEFGQWKAEEDEVTRQELEDLWLAIASGSEERYPAFEADGVTPHPHAGELLPRPDRLAAAQWRIAEIVIGNRPSMLEVAYAAKAEIEAKPWLEDIAARVRTMPGLAGDQ